MMGRSLVRFRAFTERPTVRVPEKRPKHFCRDREGIFWCNRRHGHTGRHAQIRYQFNGAVRAVWDR